MVQVLSSDLACKQVWDQLVSVVNHSQGIRHKVTQVDLVWEEDLLGDQSSRVLNMVACCPNLLVILQWTLVTTHDQINIFSGKQ